MVKPLSKIRRIFFLIVFVIFFIILLPIVVLYSSGYRLDEDYNLVKTGAVYLEVPYDGAEVYLDGKKVGETGFFRNSFFIQDLTPKRYTVKVVRDGYTDWSKYLYVKEQFISKGKTITVPKNIVKNEIIKNITISTSTKALATTTKKDSKDTKTEITKAYKYASDLFATTTSPLSYVLATTTGYNAKFYEKMLIYSDKDNTVYSAWTGNKNFIPDFMCSKNDCDLENRIVVADGLKYFDYFPYRNDVIIYSDKEGVFVVDADVKSPKNKFIISDIKDSDFRIDSDNIVYLREGDKYYSIDLGQN